MRGYGEPRKVPRWVKLAGLAVVFVASVAMSAFALAVDAGHDGSLPPVLQDIMKDAPTLEGF